MESVDTPCHTVLRGEKAATNQLGGKAVNQARTVRGIQMEIDGSRPPRPTGCQPNLNDHKTEREFGDWPLQPPSGHINV
jgi:hypothetical protein